ncbi:antA/AntB antirepressor family protein [Bartonella tribocorum]|uniref:Phage antirepressor Ant n=1 Tax=Bartonella tribocorum TaxID=85701 RepID=A0A2M6UR03_9HYPH|nr:antA/AntB antirepressor family protein [Bartonella tribocorum]PIT68602.1 phage antirepressor Ant [Bartonella tribocorum]
MTLIKISEQAIGQEIVQTVSARELHAFLEAKRDFSNWIKDRINKYNLLENQDYLVFTNFGENLQGGRPSKDYALSLSVAKELSMVENNKKGREARLYFNFLFDNMSTMCLLSNQVLEKHLKHIADRLPKQSFHRQLKALTHYMLQAYNNIVGCGYAIQYPYGKGITTGYVPCFSAPGALHRVSMKNL